MHRRVPVLISTAALIAGAAGAALASPAAAITSTGRALPGAAALRVAGAVDRGVAPSATRTVTLVLNQRNAAGLAKRIANPHAARLSRAQFLARYAPSAAQVSTVTGWAKAAGLRTRVPANRAFVQITGRQAVLGRALGVRFDRFSRPSGPDFVASVGTARLPAGVTGVTRSIVGLSSLGRVGLIRPETRSDVHPDATSVTYPTSYTPQQLNGLYDAPSGQTGSGQTLAIITEGDVSQPVKDLATFEQQYGLPSVSWHTISVGTPSTDTSGDDEWDLDSQYSTAFAPGATTLDDYNGPSLSNTDILSTINRWVSDDSTRQASFSAGECEVLAEAGGFTSGLDAVLAEAAAQGQSLFVSTGDNGAYCAAVVGINGIPAGVPDVEYPAASPDAIGVGGTSVLGSGPTEISWYAGGGGVSLFESAPAWQSGAGGSFVGVERGVPDVSLDADPESGYDVVVDGSTEVIGGTSASAPSWQGIWARVQGAKGGGLGFAGPVLYQTEPASAFHDVTLGTNGLFVASPGWDYTTGLGTADIAGLVAGG